MWSYRFISYFQRTASSSGLGPGDILCCPSCRHEVPVPQNGVAGFPTNFNLTRLTQIVNERRKARRRKPPAQLVSALSSMQETIHKAKETRDQLKKRYREIHHRKQKCVRDIEARRDYVMSLVHDYVQLVLNNVEVTYETEMNDLNKNLEVLESQITMLQKVGGVGLNDPKFSPIQTLRNQLDKVTNFASNLSALEETLREVNMNWLTEPFPCISESFGFTYRCWDLFIFYRSPSQCSRILFKWIHVSLDYVTPVQLYWSLIYLCLADGFFFCIKRKINQRISQYCVNPNNNKPFFLCNICCRMWHIQFCEIHINRPFFFA